MHANYLVDINPVAISIGPLQVHWYGLMYLLGFAAAWLLGERRRRQGALPVTSQQFSDLLFYGMLGVIIGGRVGYMLFYARAELLADPLSLLRIWDGGMSFHGGLGGVMLALWLWAHRQRLAFFDVADFVAPLVPIGLGLGRLGNFIGGELWGRTSDVPWAMIFPAALPPSGQTMEQLRVMAAAGELAAQARHPSQLYQMLLEGVIMFTVLWLFSRRARPRYAVSGLFMVLYGVFRFAVEFFREPDAQLGYIAFGWLTMGQLLSLPLVAAGILLLLLSRRAPVLARVPQAEPVEEKG